MNTARYAVLAAGLPESVPGHHRRPPVRVVAAGPALRGAGRHRRGLRRRIAGGVESMSRIPIGSSARRQGPFGRPVAARYPAGLVPQGIGAELIAAKWAIGRAASSTSSPRPAASGGRGATEDGPVPARGRAGHRHPRRRHLWSRPRRGHPPVDDARLLAGLRPAFHDEGYAARFPEIAWNVTAGNASQVNDGSAALLITTSEKAAELGLTPRPGSTASPSWATTRS